MLPSVLYLTDKIIVIPGKHLYNVVMQTCYVTNYDTVKLVSVIH